MTTLLLNADYTPISIVSFKKVVSYLSKNKVDVVETYKDRKLRSRTENNFLPSIIKMKYYVNVPHLKPLWNKGRVFSRDGWKCVYCGKAVNNHTATIDHIVPRITCKKLGVNPNTFTNTVCACQQCNYKKAARSLEDSGMKFIDSKYEPKTPRTNYLVVSSSFPSEWKTYLQF